MDENTINKLTGKPVSKEFLEIIRKLNDNICVSQKEINELPEVQYANLCTPNSKMSKDEMERRLPIQSNAFDLLQNEIKSAVTQSDGTVTFDGEIRCEKRLDIVIGLPAAGKSSALAEPLSEFYKSRLIDCDEAKKRLPGFDGGWGAGYVHPESQKVSDRQFFTAISKGENITYPRVGADCEDLKKYIEQAKKAGYKVYVHYNELDRNKALARMLSRFVETGRYLSPDLIDGKSEGIRNTYAELKQSQIDAPEKLVDGFSHWDNDVPFGERPKLKECSETCVDFCKSQKPNTVKEKAEQHDTVVEKLTVRVEELEAELRTVKAQLDKAQAQLSKTSNICRRLPKEFQEQFVQKRDELYPRQNNPTRSNSIDNTKPHKPPGGDPGSSGTKR